jgi:hypothetical protein
MSKTVDHFVFESVAQQGGNDCTQPVGNSTFVFNLTFPDPSMLEDASDQALIDSRKGEGTESMESVFARLGL